MDVLDQPSQVRPGEELNSAALLAYLQATLGQEAGDQTLELAQFPGGYSNLTYL